MGTNQSTVNKPLEKAQIDVACMKAKYDLQMMMNRRNVQTEKYQKQFVASINSNARNLQTEVALLQNITNGVKYSQACRILMEYAATLKMNSKSIAHKGANKEQLGPYLSMIYSLVYAADNMKLFTLVQFKNAMAYLGDQQGAAKLTNPDIITLLKKTPSPTELNAVALELSQRNDLAIQLINAAGHRFSIDFAVPVEPVNINENPYPPSGLIDINNPFGQGNDFNNYLPPSNYNPNQFYPSPPSNSNPYCLQDFSHQPLAKEISPSYQPQYVKPAKYPDQKPQPQSNQNKIPHNLPSHETIPNAISTKNPPPPAKVTQDVTKYGPKFYQPSAYLPSKDNVNPLLNIDETYKEQALASNLGSMYPSMIKPTSKIPYVPQNIKISQSPDQTFQIDAFLRGL